jgi:phosphotransferase system enzyme I (PtsI)
MFPFLAGVDDWRQAKAVFDRVAAGLKSAGEIVPAVPLGAMIEVPSAVLTADLLAREADFFSIGTNDLIEYTLAINRTDVRVSHLYDPLHPAVLRAIRMTARTARRHRVPVAVAGEMAADPVEFAVLLGLGVTEFSMRPTAIERVREAVPSYHTGELRSMVGRLLNGESEDEVRAYVAERMTAAEPITVPGPDER